MESGREEMSVESKRSWSARVESESESSAAAPPGPAQEQ